MANEEHVEILLSGVEKWNAWRRSNPETVPSLFRAHLFEADLSGMNLSRANLFGADLRGADLRGADLQRADLQRADLRGAELTGANLEEALLGGTRLQGAVLQETGFQESNFLGMVLFGGPYFSTEEIQALRAGHVFLEPEIYLPNESPRKLAEEIVSALGTLMDALDFEPEPQNRSVFDEVEV